MNDILFEFVLDGWNKTIRTTSKEQGEDPNGKNIYLPYPYTVPCAENTFQSLFYWDTYFANRGLLLSDRADVVKNNLLNFMYLIEEYGYIPNGTSKHLLNRSQPPFFGLMLRDYFEKTGDRDMLEKGISALKKELDFWYTKRTSPNGLCHYSCIDTPEVYIKALKMYERRTEIVRDADKEYLGKNVLAEAESGWDFNARFGGLCLEYDPVDLNSLVYFDEMFVSLHTEGDESEKYRAAAEIRKERMTTLMKAEDGIYYDYRYTTGECSAVRSCASFFVPFVGIECDSGAMKLLLDTLELDFGIEAAQPTGQKFQWGEDNGWACLQLVACEALDACGMTEEATRVAEKYVSLVEKCFDETGHLWEKYNVRTGNNQAVDEYGTPTMLGWSAGVYLALNKYLQK